MRYVYNPETLSYEPDKPKTQWPLFIARTLVILAVGYFGIGYIFALLSYFALEDYINIAAIVGGVASTVSVFSLLSGGIRKNDIEKIGLEYFEEVVVAAKNLKAKEKALKDQEQLLGAKEKELKQLELKKAELELLVQKASMTIFLKDQLTRFESKIVELVNSDKEITNAIGNRKRIIKQLKDLEEELSKENISDEVQEIIDLINREKDKKAKPEPSGILERLLKSYFKALTSI